MIGRALLLLLASAASIPATAQVTTILSNNPTPKGNGQDLNKMICEVTQTTGTRLGARKVCKTVLEWQQLRRDQRDTLESVQRQATSTGCPNGQAQC
jgi:hypothetical protein